MTIFKRNIKPRAPKLSKPKPTVASVAAEHTDARIKELEDALALEKLQHKTAREDFAKEIASINKSFGDGDRGAFTKRCEGKDALIDEFIIEMTKLLPSSDLVRRAREHRGAI